LLQTIKKRSTSFRMCFLISGGAGGICYIFTSGENYGVDAVETRIEQVFAGHLQLVFQTLPYL